MPSEVVTRNFEQPVAAAEAQQQLVVAQLGAVAQPQPLVGSINRRDPQAQFHIDLVLFVELGAAQQQPLALHFARQVFLRQRGPVVGQVGLVADEHDRSRVTFASQGVDRLHRGVAGAHDHYRPVRHADLYASVDAL